MTTKRLLYLILSVGLAGASIVTGSASHVHALGTHTPLYRLRNVSSGEHFYTVDQAEADYAVAHYGYVSEGNAGYVDLSGSSGTVPLYRLEALYAGHFYSTDQTEKDYATAHYAYSNEGTAGYMSPSSGAGLQPLYRLRTAGTNQHFYTISSTEADYATAHYGYVSEGIAGYVYLTQ